jgi:hypothetical protein
LAVTEQRERALRALEREERELIGMCARRLIDDEIFQRERGALQERRLRFEQSPATDDAGTSALQARLTAVTKKLDLVAGAPKTLHDGDPFQLRSLLQQLQLEIVLRGRHLDLTASEPLAKLVKAGSDSSWCATWSEIWKWIQFGEPAAQMNIPKEELQRMMGEDRESV